MNSPNVIRPTLPEVAVFAQNESGCLHPADRDLTAEVRGDLNRTRDRIFAKFGEQNIPAVSQNMASEIGGYFFNKGYALPRSIVIDPGSKDEVEEFRSILESAAFPSIIHQGFFAGSQGHEVSPGVLAQHDMVIFHESAEAHATEAQQLAVEWGYGGVKLDGTAELKAAEEIVHELSHLAGNMAVAAVAIQKIDGKYCLIDRFTAGYRDVCDTATSKDDDAYVGSVLDEGWAALNVSDFLLDHEGIRRLEVPITYRYKIDAAIGPNDGLRLHDGLDSLRSGAAGMILEKLDVLHPGVIKAMAEVASGRTSLRNMRGWMNSLLDPDTVRLLNTPRQSAWKQLSDMVGA